jgi:hypothetical protein
VASGGIRVGSGGRLLLSDPVPSCFVSWCSLSGVALYPMSDPPPPMPPAGWIDDPDDPSAWRYWNGSAWTEHRAPKKQAIPNSAEPPKPGGKTVERTFPSTINHVYECCRRATSDLGYTVLNSDPNSSTISFNTGRSWSTWHGQDLSASLFDEGGTTKVVVGGSLARRGSALGDQQMFGWGEKKKLSERFLGQVADLITSTPPPSPVSESKTGPDSVAGELAKLKGLQDGGVLSDEDFDRAREKLLG